MAPATNITILVGAAGAGSLDQFLSATQGTITTADDPGDTAATLSTGALAGVNSTMNISIAADATITFNDLSSTLSLLTGLGTSAAFTTSTGAISFANTANTLATAGGSIMFSAGTSLTAGNLDTGGGDVSLTSGTFGAGDLSAQDILTGGSGSITFQATNAAGGDITLAMLDAGTGAVTVKSVAGSILDGNGAANNVTGGAINLSAGGPAGIEMDVVTDTPATAGVTATTTNAPIVLRSTSRLQVDTIDAGAAGDVTLTVNNADTATSSMTGLHPDDGIANVTGRTVTLTADGLSNGTTGQIGSPGSVIKVAATTINASTNDSQLWIFAIGGAAIGSINAGRGTANLETINGDLTSTHTGSTPDVTAGTVSLLSQLESRGSFGSAASPLLLQTGNLAAVVASAGSINVTNVTAGGNLNVLSAVASESNINLAVAGGNLTTTATSGIDIFGEGSTATLYASRAVLSGTPSGVTDVAASRLAVTCGAGVGTSANPLKAIFGILAANVDTGGVFVTSDTTGFGSGSEIGTVGGLSGISATSGDITVTTNGDLTVSQPVFASGAVTLTGTSANGVGNINLNAPITGSSATVLGGTGNGAFTVTALGATPLHIDGLAGTNTLNFDGQGQHAVGAIPGELSMSSILSTLTYSNIQSVNLNNAASVDAFYGPDTADRGTALAGLTPAERFVQVLYLNALGRVGSRAEIDGWAAAFGGSSTSNAPIQAAIASAIEGSMEGCDHEVKSWYVQYLGRAAAGGEEMTWVNMLLAGQTEESVLSYILASTEFFNHAQTLGFSGTADSQYVQALYALILRRAGGAAEVAGWVGVLPAAGRQGAAMGFLDSAEFRTDQFEGYYNALLHRPSDSASLSAWVAAGLNVFTTRIDFETSSEFFSNG